jgi:chorismate dehydratase
VKAGSGKPLRIGSVSFLNARPLVRYLDLSGNPRIELLLDVPSRLAQLMEDRQLDVAMLPSVEYLRAADYRILGGICLASDGAVKSVRIFSKVPLDRISSLALDTSSRTSAALAQVLLKRRFGGVPHVTARPPDSNLWEIQEDALLLIGDAAMKFSSRRTVHILDLGEEWKRQTGLPFVYALWVARGGVRLGDLPERLLKARDEGLANLLQISAEASLETGLKEAVCFNYLQNRMRYHLGKRELEGLALFQEQAAEDGLCRGGINIGVDNC